MRTKIYVLFDPIDKTPAYIGKSGNPVKRLLKHIQQSLNKNGHLTKKEAWIKSLAFKNLLPELEILDEVLILEWKFWETHYISLFKSWGFELKNGTNGGDGWSEGHAPWNKGIALSEEFKQKLSELKIGELNNRFGKKLSTETIKKIQDSRNKNIKEIGRKISLAKKGISQSREHIEALSKVRRGRIPWNKGITGYPSKNKGRKLSNYVKEKIRGTLSKFLIQQVKDDCVIREWMRHELIRMTEYSIGNITLCCHGKRKSAYGFSWKYKKLD